MKTESEYGGHALLPDFDADGNLILRDGWADPGRVFVRVEDLNEWTKIRRDLMQDPVSQLETLLALMDDPPCLVCKGRREVHLTEELLGKHMYRPMDAPTLADWFRKVNVALATAEEAGRAAEAD